MGFEITTPDAADEAQRRNAWLLLGIVIGVAAALRLLVIDVPLERDEGEYAYLGQLMLHGSAPFEHAWNMKLPGTAAAYAVAMAVFGETIRGVRLGLLVVTSATTLLVFLLAARLFGRLAAVGAAAAFAILSLSTDTLGIFGHATHFVVLPATGALLVLHSALHSGRRVSFLAGGALFGLALLMKQPGGVFLGAGLFWIAWARVCERPRAYRRLAIESGIVVVGAAVPLLVTIAVVASAGAFERFRTWVFEYAVEYGTGVPFRIGAALFIETATRIVSQTPLVWLVAAMGAVLLARKAPGGPSRSLVLALPAFSFVGLSAGLHFREHYFILALPSISLLVGGALWAARNEPPARFARFLAPSLAAALVLGCAHSLYVQRDVFFQMTPEEVSRKLYGLNPFPESIEVARYLRAHTGPDDVVAVLGSEPQIYFYANRPAATGYIYMYPLMERHPLAQSMQEEVIRQIEQARPAYVVWVRIPTSWLQTAESETRIFDWAGSYIPRNYEVAGRVALLGFDRTEYRWNADDLRTGPIAENELLLFRRRGFASIPATDRAR